MSDSKPFDRTTADVVLTALRRTRQVRQFTDELVSDNDLQAILEVARWSGSSMNRQPWTFIVVRERGDLQRLAELAPNAKHVAGAAVAIAIAMGGDNAEWDAYDEGRAAERILIAANALGLGAGIGWAIESSAPAGRAVPRPNAAGVRPDDHLAGPPDGGSEAAEVGAGDGQAAPHGSRAGTVRRATGQSAGAIKPAA